MSFSIKENVQRVLKLFGFHITRLGSYEKDTRFQALINSHIEQYGTLNFIQIGGCDGKSFDPLYSIITSKPDAFRGIIFEPIEDYFEELESLYQYHPEIQTLRFAIHNTLQQLVLYKPDPDCLEKLPFYAKGVVSFDRSHLEKARIPQDMIIEEKVPCMSLNDVIIHENVNALDLLLIDTEGYDAEILMNYNFKKNKPAIIRFEHGLPDNIIDSQQLDSVITLLLKEGYEIIFEFYDAIAYLKKTA